MSTHSIHCRITTSFSYFASAKDIIYIAMCVVHKSAHTILTYPNIEKHDGNITVLRETTYVLPELVYLYQIYVACVKDAQKFVA